MYAFAPIKFPSAYSKIDSHASLERWVDMILKPEAEMGGYETCKPEADEILQIFDNYINILALMSLFVLTVILQRQISKRQNCLKCMQYIDRNNLGMGHREGHLVVCIPCCRC